MTSSFLKHIHKILFCTLTLVFLSVSAHGAINESSVKGEDGFTKWTEPGWIMDGGEEPSVVLLEWKYRDGEKPVYIERQTTTITVNGKVKKGAHSVRVEYHITDRGDGMARVNASWKELAAKGSGVEFLQFIKRSRQVAASFAVAPDGKYQDVEGIVSFRSLPSFPDMPVSIGSKWDGPISVDYAPGISDLMATGKVSYLLAGLADIGGNKWANITFEGDVGFSKNDVPLRKGIGIKKGKTATEAGKGVIIEGIKEGHPAFKAGLKDNDIIFKFGEFNVNSWSDLRFAISVSPAGEPVDMVILRGGAHKKVSVVPEATLSADIESQGKIKGVLVFDVTEGVLLRLVVSRFSLNSTITEGGRKVVQVLKIKSLSDLAKHPRAAFPAKIEHGSTAFAFSSSSSDAKKDRSAFKETKPLRSKTRKTALQIVDDDELQKMAEALIDEEESESIPVAPVKKEVKSASKGGPLASKITPKPEPFSTPKVLPPASATVSHTAVLPLPKKARTESFKEYFVSVSSFRDKIKADEKMDSLKKDGYNVETLQVNVRGKEWHRVLVGPFHSASDARDASRMIEDELGTKGTWVITRIKNVERAQTAPVAAARVMDKSRKPVVVRAVSKPATPRKMQTAKVTKKLEPVKNTGGGYAVAAGSFKDPKRASLLAGKLKKDGYNIYTSDEKIRGEEWQRVIAGPYKDLQEARSAVSGITASYGNLTPWVINLKSAVTSSGKKAGPGAVTASKKASPVVKKASPVAKKVVSRDLPVKAKKKALISKKGYMINLASFTSKLAAGRLVSSLKEAGYNAYITETVISYEPWYRVAVGVYEGKSEAQLFLKIISNTFNVKGARVRKASAEEIKRHNN